jgi:hypothetical protein
MPLVHVGKETAWSLGTLVAAKRYVPEDDCHLGCYSMSDRHLPTFHRRLLPLPSGSIDHTDDGGSKNLLNVGHFLPDCTAQFPR